MDTKQATYSYTSTGSAVSIKDKSTASKAMTLTDNETITDLNVTVKLYSHAVRRPAVRPGRARTTSRGALQRAAP